MSRLAILIFLLLPAAARAEEYVGAETCAGCHQAEYDEWKSSRHAAAFGGAFAEYWKTLRHPRECLACHTTGWDPATGAYAFEGVSCESCHGPSASGHPDTGKMQLATDAAACMSCHKQTYQEWRLSGHAQQNIRCFDCHAVHRQGLRQPGPEQQCGACHAQRLEDFAHATHHQYGLTCTTCHMPKPRTAGIGGTGAPAHSFFVGAETCAACHEEMVHQSHKISSLREAVDRLAQTETAHEVERLHAKVQALELDVDVQKSGGVKLALAALVLGVLLGGAIAGLTNRRNKP